MQFRAVLTLVLLVALRQMTLAGIGLSYEKAITLGDPGSDIQMVAFADIDRDGMAEAALAVRGKIIVYNLKTESVLRSHSVQTDSVRQLVFADINRDGSPDITYSAMGQATDGTPEFVVVCLDGASGRADSVIYPGYVSAVNGCNASGGAIGAFDLNSDGYTELLVAANSGDIKSLSEVTFAQTRLYYSFPDSVLWDVRTAEVSAIAYLPHASSVPGVWLVTNRCSYVASDSARSPQVSAGHGYLLPDGELTEVKFGIYARCADQPVTYAAAQPRYGAYGTSGIYGSGTEFATIVERRYRCGDTGDTVSARTMSLQMLHQPKLIETWWLQTIDTDYENFAFSPELKEAFVALEVGADVMKMFRLRDGSVSAVVTEVPSGKKMWAQTHADKVPRLVVTNGQELALYRLSLTGGSPEDGENDLLPVRLSVGQPEVNSAKTSVAVPVYVPRPGRVVAEVFDARGERMRLLADATMRQGKAVLRWTMPKIKSGVYEIRVQHEGETRTVKAVVMN